MSSDAQIMSALVGHPVAAQSLPEDQPLTAIVPEAGWQPVNVRELWHFRELIYFLTWRDVKVRYKQTLLGAAWAVLQPLMLMAVFMIFSRQVVGSSEQGPIFFYLGVMPWTFFSTAISSAGNSVLGSERLVTKIFFPRLAIPFAAVAAALVDCAISLSLLGVLMAWYHVVPDQTIVLAPVILAAIMLLALGVGTTLAALNVAYRDFRYVIPFMIQIWMLGTPSIYMVEGKVGGKLATLMQLNPMTALIGTFRNAVMGNPIDWRQFGIACLVSVILFVFGCFYFRRGERSFADVI